MWLDERRGRDDARCGRRKHSIAWRQNVLAHVGENGKRFYLFSVSLIGDVERVRETFESRIESKQMKRRPRDHSLHVNLVVCRVRLDYVGVGLRARSRSLRELRSRPTITCPNERDDENKTTKTKSVEKFHSNRMVNRSWDVNVLPAAVQFEKMEFLTKTSFLQPAPSMSRMRSSACGRTATRALSIVCILRRMRCGGRR